MLIGLFLVIVLTACLASVMSVLDAALVAGLILICVSTACRDSRMGLDNASWQGAFRIGLLVVGACATVNLVLLLRS